MEVYIWENNKSKEMAEKIVQWGQEGNDKPAIAPSFKEAVEQLINEGENDTTLTKYKDEVIKLLQLSRTNKDASEK